ncbi:hypothetical protein XENOCAPTIV_022971 [Xenoophorus captivus]|uniref:Transmembrane protein 200B n=1 Tax=Xenoophorus captivus TaxID=1517983 RepID=A0ABV0S958_9TELE
MKTQKCRGVTPPSPPCTRKPRFCLRGRMKDRMIQGKLRICSMPGAFLVLGVIVVAVGTALAVAGYWSYQFSRSPILEDTEQESISDHQPSGWSLNTKGLFFTASLLHGDCMKLLGPIIMGVGLFILICANTVLYENRDRETQLLLAQMRNVICSVSAAVPSAGLRDLAATNSMTNHYQWTAPLLKLNFCLVSACSMSNLKLEEVDIPAAQHRRCHSMSYRTTPYTAQTGLHFDKELYPLEKENHTNQHQINKKEISSQVCVRIPVESADAEEDQTHGSWPRLELGSGRRYLKLDNKEDSVDKLLDKLEQQCSYWDNSFGSGPFQ